MGAERDAINDLRENSRDLQGEQEGLREELYKIRELLEYPDWTNEERRNLERLAFDAMQDIKRIDEILAENSDLIGDLKQAEQANISAQGIGVVVSAILGLGFFAFLMWAISHMGN